MVNSNSIQNLPSSERPRERLLALTPRALSSAELVAILLGSGLKGRSSIEVARDLLSSVQGSLKELARRPLPTMTNVKGIGQARAITVQAALELGRRMAHENRKNNIQINHPRDIARLYSPIMEDLPVEEFRIATVDTQHRVLSDVLITRGILNSSLAHPREVFRYAIAENAFAIILVHNHPSGDPSPSQSDINMTDQMRRAGDIIGIPVLDHIIIGRERFISLAELGIFK